MFKIIKWYLIISFFAIVSWPFAFKYLPNNIKQSALGVAVNHVSKPIVKFVGLSGKIDDANIHDSKIVEANAAILDSLIKKIKNNQIKAVFYFYNPERFIDRLAYRQINELALNYSKTKNLIIIPIAVAEDKQKMSEFLDFFVELNTPLIFVKSTESDEVIKNSIGVKLELSQAPNIIYLDKNGQISGEGLTKEFEQKINDFLLK